MVHFNLPFAAGICSYTEALNSHHPPTPPTHTRTRNNGRSNSIPPISSYLCGFRLQGQAGAPGGNLQRRSILQPRLRFPVCFVYWGFAAGLHQLWGPQQPPHSHTAHFQKIVAYPVLLPSGLAHVCFLVLARGVFADCFFSFLQAMCFLTKQFLIKSKVNTSKKRCPSARLNLGGCIANQTTVRCSTQTSPICLEETSTLQSIMSHLVWRSQNSSS